MKFTYYGHACFLVETAGKKLLFDPFITGNPLAKDIDVKKIEADYILVSHGHGDHVGDMVTIAQQTGATVIAAAEVAGWAHNNGCAKVHGINFGSMQFEFGKLRFVPASHSSSMPDGSYGGNPGGFVISNDEGSFYYAGDTGLIMDMQLIPRFAKLSFAVLPIGGNYTMDAEEAILAADFIQCDKIVGVHFDTFEVIRVDHDAVAKQFAAAGKTLIMPEIGKEIAL